MKAIVQFHIDKQNGLTEAQVKEKLIDHMVSVMELWLKGEGTIKIEFVQTYDENYQSDDILAN